MLRKLSLAIVYAFAVFGFLLTAVFLGVKFGWTNERGIIDNQRNTFLKVSETSRPEWSAGEEWNVLKEALIRDHDAINRAAMAADISPRLIAAQLVVEQLRLFHSNRELFKTVFSPLKVLGNQSQFSWGVMGIKQETARDIERNLKDIDSPFYLGPAYENALDFETDNPDQERFERLTDETNRYYSYLYASLYMKEIIAQWKNAGFDISNRPEIASTLYNIGFQNSHPNATPKVGGSKISIGNAKYSFGRLAAEFYNSQELVEYFQK